MTGPTSASSASALTVLGIDPGLRVTGYAVLRGRAGARTARGVEIVDAGVIRTQQAEPLEARVREIFEGVREVLGEHAVGLVAVERLWSAYAHPRTAILMGHARGVVLLASALAGVPVLDLSPADVKKSLTGSGRADKPQMQRAVASVFGLAKPPEPHDVCDAIAIALTALTRQRG